MENLTDDDSVEVAKEALVTMVVGLRGHWKVPVPYYLVSGITASLQAGILRNIITHYNSFNLRTMSVTCDGTGHNIVYEVSWRRLDHLVYHSGKTGSPRLALYNRTCKAQHNKPKEVRCEIQITGISPTLDW